MSTGFTFGTQPAAATTTTSSTGFNFGTATTSAGSTGGFSLGQSTGFTLGGSATTTTASSTTSVAGGILGGGTTGGFNLGGKQTTAGFGTSTATAGTGTGFTFGAAKTTAGITLGTAAKPVGTLGGTTTTTTGLTLGGTTTTQATGFSFGGGIGGTGQTATSSAATGLSKGLGGVDPTTTTSSTGSTSANGKSSDSKAVKETPMPPEISKTVEEFKKYVKEQKGVREEITRMSSKQMYKVQEEVTSLRQLLSLVTNSLQRNAISIDKLKHEAAQELKHAEIAQRTKDTPPGLQYENTAPNEYFHDLVREFEVRMVLYRQQIEEMESHLASMQQPAMLTPQELSMLLGKLHESFVALAAQLQVVHDSVRAQKEHYLNYRKVFHGDTVDIFEKRRKAVEKVKDSKVTTTVGPTPFTGMTSAAAIAMATALNKSQQPAAAAGGASGLGLGNMGQTTGLGTGIFGSTGTQLGATAPAAFGSTGFGAPTTTTQTAGFSFGSSTNTATVRPLGLTTGSTNTGGGLFGSGTTSGTSTAFQFGTSTQQTGQGFGATPAPAGTQTPAFGTQQQQFQLQKPPTGNKRGKKT